MMKDVKTILVPVDFSDNSIKITRSAIDVTEKFGARLSFVYVVQSFDDYSGFFVPHMPISQFQDEMLTSAEKKMESFVEEHIDPDLSCTSKVLVGDVGEEIVGYAAKAEIGMIIMGTHGYKGIERVLFGSVAEQVVKTAPCPVLTINPYNK